MSQIPQLLRALQGPLLIEPGFGRLLCSVFARKLAGERFTGLQLHAELGIAAARPRRSPEAGSARIAVIPVYGVIAQHPQSLGTSADDVDHALAVALNDRAVDAILFEFDSPGGSVAGVPETAARIREAGKVKPTAAVANGMAASAAYWWAAQTHHVTVLGSGDGVGSIGVWTAHEDWSKALDQAGVKVTPISAGKYKLEGAYWAPLSAEAAAHLQSQVDTVFGTFVKDVAAGRKDTQTAVREGYGEGRVLRGEQAVKAKLADEVGTFEDALARLAHKVSGRRGPSAARVRQEVALDTGARMA